jgi:hypothetical protein
MRMKIAASAAIVLCVVVPAMAQLGGSGTVQGTVKDPTGGVMVSVSVDLSSPVSGFKRSTATDAAGQFVFRNLPPNTYHLDINAQGFASMSRDIDVRTSVPIDLPISLALAGQTTSVEVVGTGQLVERDPTAHTDIDQSLMRTLPIESSSGLNQVIMLASPGVVADTYGFFHPADMASALALTRDQQAAIGVSCGGTVATVDAPIGSCNASSFGVTRLRIPAEGTEDDTTNPPRVAPRHLFDIGLGVDNLFHGSGTKMKVRFSVVNLTNKEALYNFLSTFSGTHFVTPRAYQVEAGISF